MTAPVYLPPLLEMQFALELFDCADELSAPVLDEAGKFASQVLSPLNHAHDVEGSQLQADGSVKTPEGMKQAYTEFCQNGWNSAGFDESLGGMGLSRPLAVMVSEMWHAAHMSFGLCPMLTQSAIEMLAQHGTSDQKDHYLTKLVSGEWTGTMCMTEPHAGSDIGLVKTRAVKQGDDYKIIGTKIYITFGEHDLTDNIIHIVLARLEDAPEGVRGLSLFIVPKILADGSRNDVKCVSLEHKLGIHASPTCVMGFGENEGAVGYLLGEENRGIQTMFIMMNAARFAVGMQGLGILRYAYQLARDYAAERVQGRGETIDKHADIQRLLLTMQSHDLALRLMAVHYAQALEQGDSDRVELLTPIVKSHMTQLGFDATSHAMQVMGGMGYMEETGVAQAMRDSRIALIYEGTNGIQALDLSGRKLMIAEGRAIKALLSQMWNDANDAPKDELSAALLMAIEALDKATVYQQQCLNDNLPETIKAAHFAAEDYLRCAAITIEGWLLLKALAKAKEEEKYHSLMPAILFFMYHILPEAGFHSQKVLNSYKLVAEFPS